jgi:hypothetical protein
MGTPEMREEPGQYSQPARSRQVHSRNADERETPEEEATPGPEGIRPAAKSSSSERKGVERTRRPRRNTFAAAPFQEEYREFLRKYGVEYDERYL